MQQNETKVSNPNMHIRASVDYISENVTDIVFNRTLHIKLWNWTCGPGGDQRVAIFEAPEAPPPPGASPPGERLEKKTARLSFISVGKRLLHARWRKMASPRTVTIVALSFALGLFFVFMGTIKLTPRLSKDAYSEMVSKPSRCCAHICVCVCVCRGGGKRPLFWALRLE